MGLRKGNKEISSLKKIPVKLAEKTITENGVYRASDDGLGGYNKVNVNVGGIFTGSYDTEGLKTIGWSEEEIEYYNNNGVQWNESENDVFKLTDEELAGDESSSTRFLPKSSTLLNFKNYKRLLAIPELDTSAVTDMRSMFSGCSSLTTIPQLDTSSVTSMYYMFNACSSLTAIPELNTSAVTNMSSMFDDCSSLKTIPLLDTSKVTEMSNMFLYCHSLKAIPQLDTSNVTSMGTMFQGCYSLTTIPLLDTSKVTNMYHMFYNCYSLKTIPLLDTSAVYNINYMFRYCSSLTDLGGLLNLGQAYSTYQYSFHPDYRLDLSSSTLLTHDSLMNIINNLYDIKAKGCKEQYLYLGSTNLAKLTSDEIAVATNKGWTVG